MSLPDSPQLDLRNANPPKATGDVLDTDSRVPATVPVPLPVVMVRVEGPFTALDRKLWLVLLHNAWHEMEHGFEGGKKFHSVSIAEVLRLFRKFGRTDLGKSGTLQMSRNSIEDTEAAPIWDINEHADEAGFTVAYEAIREGKSFSKIKFTVSKTRDRANKELFIKEAAKRKRGFKPTAPTTGHYEPTDAVLNQLREIAPGWDRQALLAQYREWIAGKPAAKNPHGSFIGWVKKIAKGKPPS
eukprot:gene2955-3620_t